MFQKFEQVVWTDGRIDFQYLTRIETVSKVQRGTQYGWLAILTLKNDTFYSIFPKPEQTPY